MTTYPITQAKDRLESLIIQTEQGHIPIANTSQHGNAVLITEDDWNSIQEALYLLSFPGMCASRMLHGDE